MMTKKNFNCFFKEKHNRFKNKKKLTNIISFSIVMLVLCLSIGYSSFTNQLAFNDISSLIRVSSDIRITGFSTILLEGEAISNYEDYNINSITSSINLPNRNSSVTYKISVTNFQFSEMVLLDLIGLPDNLKYEFTDNNYVLKEKICDNNNNCNLGVTKDINITISYKDDGYVEGVSSYNFNLNFLFAEYSSIEITLNFDANGGVVDTSEKKVLYGMEYGSLPIPTRDGYTFSGWTIEKNGKEIITEKTIVNNNNNHTLYAQWNAKNYTIRFNANGGSGVMVEQVVMYDAIIPLSKNKFVKEGYTFSGWALSEDGEKVYNDMDNVVNLKLDGIVDLYALWINNSHTVTFDYNGGTGSSSEMQVLSGSPYGALPDYPYLKGKLFIGWFTEKNGGKQIYSYTIVDTESDHTLYAHWEDSPSNEAMLDLVIKNVPDQNGDGVMDAIYLSFKCSSSYEKYNIPLKNLIVGQKYRLSFTASNNAEFGDSEAGYYNSMYGSIITKEGTLSAGSIKDEAINDGGLIAQWSDRTKGNTWLNGPFDLEMIFTAEANTMYWTWDFGLMKDYVLYDFNFTNIKLEYVVPKINFANKEMILHTTSKAQVLNDVTDTYSTNFEFDGDGYAETLYYPITGLTIGSKYTITFNHKFIGSLIDDSSKTSTLRYEYGCGIMNSVPTKYGSYLSDIGTWSSNTFVMTSVVDSIQKVTFSFTATSNTVYWVWNMANCSDSINSMIDVKITNFSVIHSSGDSITYYYSN